MKTLIKTIICLQATAMFMGAALAGPRAQNKAVSFQGSIKAVEVDDVEFPTMFVNGSGTGNATHLGGFAVTYEFVVDLTTGAGTGSAHFITANGDSLSTTIVAQGDPTGTPNINLVVESHAITGGTGRFVGATGSFTLKRLVNIVTGVTRGSFYGTISLWDFRGHRTSGDEDNDECGSDD